MAHNGLQGSAAFGGSGGDDDKHSDVNTKTQSTLSFSNNNAGAAVATATSPHNNNHNNNLQKVDSLGGVRSYGSLRYGHGGVVKKVVSVSQAGAASGAGGNTLRAPMRGATIRRRTSRVGASMHTDTAAAAGGPVGPSNDDDGDSSPSPKSLGQRKVSFSDPVFGAPAGNHTAANDNGSRPATTDIFPPADKVAPTRKESASGAPAAASSATNANINPNAAGGPHAPQQPSSSLNAPGNNGGATGGFGFNNMHLSFASPTAPGPGDSTSSRRGSFLDDSDNANGPITASFEVREDGKRRRRPRGNNSSMNATNGCRSDGLAPGEKPSKPSLLTRLQRTLRTKSLSPDTKIVTATDAAYIVITFLYALFSISVFISPITYGANDEPPALYIVPLAAFNAVILLWTVLRPWVRVKRGPELIDDPSQIREEYFKSAWVVLDALNALPIEFIFVRMAPLAFSILVARHSVIGAMRTLFLAQSTDPLDPQPKQWVLLTIFVGASITLGHFTAAMYWRLEEVEPHGSGVNLPLTYTDALYYSIATLTSTGYGDITANQQHTRTFSSVMMLVGVALISGLTAIVTSVLTSKDVLQEEQDRMRRMMGSMLRHYQIPFSLQREVIAHFPTVLNAVSEQGFSNMIQQLPGVMESKIKDYLRAKLLRQVPLFADLPQPDEDEGGVGGPCADAPSTPGTSSNSGFDVVLALSRKLKVRYTEQWEYIISAGETGEEMYILVHGAVDVLIPTGNVNRVEVTYEDGTTGVEEEEEERLHTTLRSGSFFGEIALIEDTRRTASIQAIQVCELLVLSRADLNAVTEKSPELQQTLSAAVKKRRDEINNKQQKIVSKLVTAHQTPPALHITDDGPGSPPPNPLRAAAAKALKHERESRSQQHHHQRQSSADSTTPDDHVVADTNSSAGSDAGLRVVEA